LPRICSIDTVFLLLATFIVHIPFLPRCSPFSLPFLFSAVLVSFGILHSAFRSLVLLLAAVVEFVYHNIPVPSRAFSLFRVRYSVPVGGAWVPSPSRVVVRFAL
jgi:hypothetical protein